VKAVVSAPLFLNATQTHSNKQGNTYLAIILILNTIMKSTTS
jgi:hypothetical protein